MKNNSEQILANLDISAFNAMQTMANSAILNNNEIVLIAPTGSGKTIGFLFPLLELLDDSQKHVQCLILVPTRELCLQIEQVWKKMGTGYKVNVCYGGHAMPIEVKNLSIPPTLLIGTPGRIADHIKRGTFALENISILILDEFDKSLQFGFHDDMQFIISKINSLRKKILVSATTLHVIPAFVKINTPQIIDFTVKENNNDNDLSVKIVMSEDKDKLNTLYNLLCNLNGDAALIFCNHRESCERTALHLNEKGIQAIVYHGGMEQPDREKALVQFRNGSVHYLVTTDLAARGLDIPEMKHVIHYQLPLQENDFVHRNGRTARMNAKGTAYLLMSKNEKQPAYITSKLSILQLKEGNPIPEKPIFVTINISGGKKNKINKVDIVGAFVHKGMLQKDDIGLIEIKDFNSFVAVKRDKVNTLLLAMNDHKIKGNKYKIANLRF